MVRSGAETKAYPEGDARVRPAQTGRRRVRVGLVGHGIQKSRTPAMHESEGTAQGLSYEYRLFDTQLMDHAAASLAAILNRAEAEGFAGLNITHPFKIDVTALVDELSPAAEAVGAVNTVVFRDGRRHGHNTDLWGFAESFRRNMTGAARDSVVLVGAGGGGAAVAHALAEIGASRILIADACQERAARLAASVNIRHGSGRADAAGDIHRALETADGLVNATPVGMAHFPGMPVSPDALRPELWVADIVYFPLETELLRTARAHGCLTLPGEGMAVFQAVRAFELFCGLKPEISRMEATFRAFDTAAPR